MSKHREYWNLIKENCDLVGILCVVGLYKISICFHVSYLQMFIAPFVIYLLGFAFLAMLFPRESISNFQRFSLSLIMGVTILPVAGLMSILVFGIINAKNLSTSIFILVFICIFLSICQRKITKEKVFTIELSKLLNIKNINLLLALAVIFLIGMLIRVYPFISYSVFPGTWFSPNSFYPTLYTVRTGRLLKNVGNMHIATAFAATIYNYLPLKGFILFQTSFFLMFGLTNLQQMLLVNKYLPWVGALLLPLAAIVIANKLEERGKYKLSDKDYILIFLLGSFPSFYIVYLTKRMCVALPYGWLFILLSIYTLMDERVEYRILSAIFGFSIVWYYYTAASTYFIILMTVLVFQLVLRKKVISMNYILMYSIIYIGYLMYLAERFFYSYTRVLETLISQKHMEVVTAIGKYTTPIAHATLWYITIYLNGMLISIVCVLFVYLKIKDKLKHPCSDRLLFVALGLLTVTVVFFRWRGLKGVMGRMEQYASIVLLAVFPVLLLEYRKSKFNKLLLYLVAILIIFTSIFGHLSNNVMQPGYITHTEEYAIKWYTKYGNNERVFTDFRIGTAPFLLNCWKFTGVMTVPHEVKMEELQKLINIYYTNNATLAYDTLLRYYKPSLLLLSKEMCTRGVVTSSENFRPVSTRLFLVYDNSNFFNKVYNNGGAYYYKLVKLK